MYLEHIPRFMLLLSFLLKISTTPRTGTISLLGQGCYGDRWARITIKELYMSYLFAKVRSGFSVCKTIPQFLQDHLLLLSSLKEESEKRKKRSFLSVLIDSKDRLLRFPFSFFNHFYRLKSDLVFLYPIFDVISLVYSSTSP